MSRLFFALALVAGCDPTDPPSPLTCAEELPDVRAEDLFFVDLAGDPVWLALGDEEGGNGDPVAVRQQWAETRGVEDAAWCSDLVPVLVLTRDEVEKAQLGEAWWVQPVGSFGAAGWVDSTPTPTDEASADAIRLVTGLGSDPNAGTGWTVIAIDSGIYTDHPGVPVVDQSACVVTNGATCAQTAKTSCSDMSPACAVCDTNPVECMHGMATAGLIAGRAAGTNATNKIAVSAAPGAKLLPVRSLTRSKSLTPGSSGAVVAKALEAALGVVQGGGKVAAVYLGSTGDTFYTGSCDGSESALSRWVNRLASNGVPVVAPSGNDGWKDRMPAPGCLSGVLSVGSAGLKTNDYAGVVESSNVSGELDLVAPGVQVGVMSRVDPTGKGNGDWETYAQADGTSFAAALAAGAIAAQRAADPSTATDIPNLVKVLSNGSCADAKDATSGGSYAGLCF